MNIKLWLKIALAVACLFALAIAAPVSTSRHQGGDALNWAIPGTTNYAVGCTLQQNGAIQFYSPAPVTSGDIYITYPTTYGGGKTPLILAFVDDANPDVTLSVVPVFAGAHFYWKSVAPRNSVLILWQAEGVCP